MAILRPMLMPTVGVPQAVVASRRPRNMSQKEFYSSQQRPGQQLQQPQQQNYTPQTQQTQDTGQQFEQEPITGDYLQEQLARYNERTPPPSLDPGARVQSANAELVQPSNFQVFYEQMNAITQSSQEQVGAETARSIFRRSQEAQTTLSESGLPIGYKNKSLKKGGNIGGAQGGAIPSNPATNFKFAQQIAPQFGWSGNDLNAWYTLGMKESGWRNTAQNPTSTAFGIGQFLNSTWAGVGMAKTSDPQQQVLAMAKYIKNRYGSPSKALAFHLAHNWY